MANYFYKRIMSETIRIKDNVSFVYGFQLDRTAEWDFARNLIRKRKRNEEKWTFYGKWPGMGEVVLARKTNNEEYEVVFPHCKYPVCLKTLKCIFGAPILLL